MPLGVLLAPVFVQVALTLGLLCTLGPTRLAAIRRGEVKIGDVALGQNAWPARATQLANAYRNQFELPVLFYVAMLVALVTHNGDVVVAGLAWVFVGFRLAHAYVHVTTNNVPSRFRTFLGSVIALAGLWLWLALRIFIVGS